MRFIVEGGKEVEIPDSWLKRAMLVRQALGMSPNEAAEDAVTRWLRTRQEREGSKIIEIPS
jgi:hypothetical protein